MLSLMYPIIKTDSTSSQNQKEGTCNPIIKTETPYLNTVPKPFNLAIRELEVNKILRVEVLWKFVLWEFQPVEVPDLL